MRRDELIDWLDGYLDVHAFNDSSLNGLQVEGDDTVTKVAVGVDGSYNTIEKAIEAGAQLLIVHHGLFWGKEQPVTKMLKSRLKLALENDLSIYACHLPLDAHQEVGNNWGLARELGLRDLEGFVEVDGRPLGVKGRLPQPRSLTDLAEHVEKVVGEQVLVHAGGPDPVTTLGIVSGGAAGAVLDAADAGLDAFLTGEPKHDTFYYSYERHVSSLFAGHYMTETVGVKLLAAKLETTFGLETEFLLMPTGL